MMLVQNSLETVQKREFSLKMRSSGAVLRDWRASDRSKSARIRYEVNHLSEFSHSLP